MANGAANTPSARRGSISRSGFARTVIRCRASWATIDRTDPAGPKDDALLTFDTTATFADDVFAFVPPAGFEKIEFETVLGVK